MHEYFQRKIILLISKENVLLLLITSLRGQPIFLDLEPGNERWSRELDRDLVPWWISARKKRWQRAAKRNEEERED